MLTQVDMSMYKLSESPDRLQNFAESATSPKSETHWDTFLKFAIDPHTIGLIESEFAQEVITVRSGLITPVPNKPSCILGILSHRRRVYWATDLAMLLGLQPLDQNILLYEVILACVQERSLALIVPKIFGIAKISGDRIDKNTMSIPSVMRPHIKGYFQEQGDLFYLLQAESILSSAILHS